MPLSIQVLHFLQSLQENNSREWFNDHKEEYKLAKSQFDSFVEELIPEFAVFENMEGIEVKHCVFRIYRDVRFSKDKAPYKPWFSAAFSEGGKNSPFMDYYLHIESGNSFLGGGMYAPEPEHLAKLRQEIDYNGEALLKIIQSKSFVSTFGKYQGEALKKAPKGYADDHPYIDLLKQKQLFFMRNFTDEQVVSDTFKELIIRDSKQLKPLLDFLNMSIFDKVPN